MNDSDDARKRYELINFRVLDNGIVFEAFCKALLNVECTQLQVYSAPDGGIDAFDVATETVFQFYFPERAARKDKIVKDLKKVLKESNFFRRWVLILPKDPTPPQKRWVDAELQGTQIQGLIWGETELRRLLRKHPSVREEFFPTEVQRAIRRLAKGKKPCSGDAEDWLVISAVEAEEVRRSLHELAEASVVRKGTKKTASLYIREFMEFNAHFHLSSYDKLPKVTMGDARQYLQQKLYARRSGESQEQKRKRYIRGIRGISAKLKLSDDAYRQLLRSSTGFTSTNDLSVAQLVTAFRELRKRQDAHDSEAL